MGYSTPLAHQEIISAEASRSPGVEAPRRNYRKDMQARVAAKLALSRREREVIASFKAMNMNTGPTLKPKQSPSTRFNCFPIGGDLVRVMGNRIRKAYRPCPLTPMLSQPPRRPKRLGGIKALKEEDLYQEELHWIPGRNGPVTDEASAMRREQGRQDLKGWHSQVARLRSRDGAAGGSPRNNKRSFDQMVGMEFTSPVSPHKIKRARMGARNHNITGGFGWSGNAESEVAHLTALFGEMALNVSPRKVDTAYTACQGIHTSMDTNRAQAVGTNVSLLTEGVSNITL